VAITGGNLDCLFNRVASSRCAECAQYKGWLDSVSLWAGAGYRSWRHAGWRVVLFNFYSGSGRLHLKCDGIRTETRFHLSAKMTSPFKSAGASVQSTTGSRGVRNSGSNAGYTMYRDSVKGTDYPLYSPVPPSLPLLCVTVCHHISTGLYLHY